MFGTKRTKLNVIRTGLFSTNLVSREMLPLMDYFGSKHAKNGKKNDLSYGVSRGEVLDVPTLDESPWVYECEVARAVETGDSTMFFCHIRNIQMDETLCPKDLFDIDLTVELLETKPDIYVFDGNGYLHPRHAGIATHASFYLDKPTFGVAKSYFRVDKQTDYDEPAKEAGSFTDIVIDGEVYGRALRTHRDIRPIFVSVGNHISLETACRLALLLTIDQRFGF